MPEETNLCLFKDPAQCRAFFEDMHTRAAEKGAQCALERIGLGDEKAGEDLKAMRAMVNTVREAKSAAFQTFIRVLVAALMSATFAGIAFAVVAKAAGG